MEHDGGKSNLDVRSNLYVRKGDTYFWYEDIDFLHQVRGRDALEKLSRSDMNFITEFQQHQLSARCCYGGEARETTFGPIRKDAEIIYGCRCILKDTCEHRHKPCETCIQYKG